MGLQDEQDRGPVAHVFPEHPKARYPTWRNLILAMSYIPHNNPTQAPSLSPLQETGAQRTEGHVQVSGLPHPDPTDTRAVS